MEYFNIKKNWKKKIKPMLSDKILNEILVIDFKKYLKLMKWKKEFRAGMFPFEFESCDWYLDKKGRPPEYWKCVKHGACHFLVRYNLRLAKLVDPNRDWQIISSDLHSTVWDGENTIFEFNFYAFGIPADTAFEMAAFGSMKDKAAAQPKMLEISLFSLYFQSFNWN